MQFQWIERWQVKCRLFLRQSAALSAAFFVLTACASEPFGAYQGAFGCQSVSADGCRSIVADTAIVGGVLVDGTRQAPYLADIALLDGKIIEIAYPGRLKAKSLHEIDVDGEYVTPGFIDTHAHGYPLKVDFHNKSAMGVTTIVLGQDGVSPEGSRIAARADRLLLREWVELVNKSGESVNIIPLVGHGSLRTEAGVGLEPASPSSLQRMLVLLETAMSYGAYGLSQGLEYSPGLYAEQEELIALAKVVGFHDGVIHSHMRTEDTGAIDAAVEELFAQGEFSNVHISHLKIVMGNDPAEAKDLVQQLSKKGRYRKTADVYPYTAGVTGMSLIFPEWAKTRAQFDRVVVERRDELASHLQERIEMRNGPSAMLFASGQHIGKTLEEAALEMRKPYVDLLIDDIGPDGAVAAYFVMEQEVQDVFVLHPDVSISSDGYPTIWHPRGYGTYVRILETYVKKTRQLSIHDAIWKMTGLPAKQLGVTDRGRLAVGLAADIAVFDLADVEETATWDKPIQFAKGMSHVFVNGTEVWSAGSPTGEMPGRVLLKSN